MKAWRGRGETVSNRVLTETKAGKFSADVTYSSNEFFPLLIKGNLVARYSSPERVFYSNASKDGDGLWTSVGYVMTVIAYNRILVPRAETPRNYEDFLNPKWKGNFAIDSNPDRLVMGWLKLWGGEKTERFLQALIKNEASVRAGHSLMAQLLCAGEFKTAMELYAHRIADLKEKECPAELVFPGPTIGAGGFLYLPKRAPHPYAAALLMDHLLSATGRREVFRIARAIPVTPLAGFGRPVLFKKINKSLDQMRLGAKFMHGDVYRALKFKPRRL